MNNIILIIIITLYVQFGYLDGINHLREKFSSLVSLTVRREKKEENHFQLWYW